MIKSKESVINILQSMDNSQKNLDDILYTLYFKVKLIKSEDDFENGRFITFEESKREMEALYENYNIQQCTQRHTRNL